VILVDTSVWIDHLRAHDAALDRLLEADEVLIHPFVIGEVALGVLPERNRVLDALLALPQAEIADPDEVLHFINAQCLSGAGLGYVDAHLLASVRLTVGARLWTRDKRMHAIAERMESAHVPSGGGVAEAPASYGS
jgi:predicted nucleic acid-binding protein